MLSLVLLLAAKLATIAVPFTFKWATDALAGEGSAPFAASSWLTWLFAAPIAMTLAYGGMRIVMAALTQMRDGIFAKVSMHAVRRLAYRTFEHMHELSLRFHLERKTGGLTRVLERGRNAIETIVRMLIVQLAPRSSSSASSRESCSISSTGVMSPSFSQRSPATWCSRITRLNGASDSPKHERERHRCECQSHRFAAQLRNRQNFVAEEREARRYDRSMARYEEASVKAYVSLAVLNAGQAAIFTIGLSALMVMCAVGIRNGSNTVGDLVMINAMMIQLYQPLNSWGWSTARSSRR